MGSCSSGLERHDTDRQATQHQKSETKERPIAKSHHKLAELNLSSTGDGLDLPISGQWSKGSALHAAGTCKPCAWSWRVGGCIEGAACMFCHTCDAAAHKQYRKDKFAARKEQRRADKDKVTG